MNETITSAQNPTVKLLRKLLTNSKERRDTNTFVAEGIHLTKSFLASRQVPLLYAYAASATKNKEVSNIIEELSASHVRGVELADSLFESISNVHAPVGVLITFSPVSTDKKTFPLKANAVLLEDIQDPGNIGTILRTAAATGIIDVFLSSGCASPWSPKALRAGMGAQFGLSIIEKANLKECIAASTIPTYATVLTPDSQSLYELDLKRPVAWVFGNEGLGVSTVLSSLSSSKVSIPQVASTVESLNVAAAATVCLYEQFRQNST